ncbi:uncharacterized protein Asalp_22340 [Aeromonas salmonicida subsp. pectinolytica 34mel]|uniref:Uncharacterized protein n=1 Tax=Aeromonas salmonicida subsp. pectinolytica 34mel TaxID=1324960 RepID=T0PNF9_AERSA|nr:uncharacterized protein Asalp_22340 [Aeromonas salmonicida subsp. pectinolytica 34mel]EQC04311.1 hypothetical protein K931_10818 [Aeromonas salmonicida subsp. pectinolytica 34mel]
MHSVSSKANWGAIVGSKLGKMCERAHALYGQKEEEDKGNVCLAQIVRQLAQWRANRPAAPVNG